jgi:uncharacterized protein (TIGR02444 family)
MPEDGSNFWDFSLAVYGDDGVQQECLDLQQRYGVNINLLLFCAFVGTVCSATLAQADLHQAERVVHEWHSAVVSNLRAARRELKPLGHAFAPIGLDSLLNVIKERELEAERLEQTMLEHWSTQHLHTWSRALPSVAVEKNIATLFEVCIEVPELPKLPSNLIASALRYATKLHQVAPVSEAPSS